MAGLRVMLSFALHVPLRHLLSGVALLAATGVLISTVDAQAQQAQSAPSGHVIVIGEGSVRDDAAVTDHIDE